MGNQQELNLDQKQKKVSNAEFKLRLQRLKDAIDAEQLLRLLGFEISRSSDKELRAPCKIHGGDNKSAFRYNKVTNTWLCFSHGCHEKIGYDIIDLVKHIRNVTFWEAISFLENIAGIDIRDERGFVEYKRQQDRLNFIRQNDNHKVPPALVNEDYLKYFNKFRSTYFETEGYPDYVLDFFEVGGGYVDVYNYQRDVIPIRNDVGKLMAFSCRDITGKASYDFKYLLTEDFHKDKCLYNLHRAKEYMGDKRTIIVVEGFKSVWKLFMAGFNNVVACMGSSITNGQQNLLYKYAFRVILLFDADTAGIEGTKRAMRDMVGKIKVSPVFIPYSGKDPSDCTIEELHDILGGII